MYHYEYNQYSQLNPKAKVTYLFESYCVVKAKNGVNVTSPLKDGKSFSILRPTPTPRPLPKITPIPFNYR